MVIQHIMSLVEDGGAVSVGGRYAVRACELLDVGGHIVVCRGQHLVGAQRLQRVVVQLFVPHLSRSWSHHPMRQQCKWHANNISCCSWKMCSMYAGATPERRWKAAPL